MKIKSILLTKSKIALAKLNIEKKLIRQISTTKEKHFCLPKNCKNNFDHLS